MDLLKLGGKGWPAEFSSSYSLLQKETSSILTSTQPSLEGAKRTLIFRLEALRKQVIDISYEMQDLSAEITEALEEQGEITPTPDQATRLQDLKFQKEMARLLVVPFTLAYCRMAEGE